jgi:hypothetical protein
VEGAASRVATGCQNEALPPAPGKNKIMRGSLARHHRQLVAAIGERTRRAVSASSFVTMFKKVLGKPPVRYLRSVNAGEQV